MTEKRGCGTCKYFQIDGMFGLWCDKGKNWEKETGNCIDWEYIGNINDREF